MKGLIKKIIPNNSKAFKLLQKIYHHKYWHPKTWKFDIVKAYAEHKKNVSFIQIGSNNGIDNDPIHKHIIHFKWTGVLVEPVPHLFEDLKKNYDPIKERFSFENSAIAAESGKLKFYRLKKSDVKGMPIWYEQIGSFNKAVVEKHKNRIPNFDELLIEDSVNTITFKELLQKHNIQKADLIHIDTEGHDYEILKLIPFAELKVELVMFEHVHLSAADFKSALDLLKRHNFSIGAIDEDVIAVNTGVLAALS
jgi:FkbM family methyltransferase